MSLSTAQKGDATSVLADLTPPFLIHQTRSS
jgi:hypothetical protein